MTIEMLRFCIKYSILSRFSISVQNYFRDTNTKQIHQIAIAWSIKGVLHAYFFINR